MKLIFKLLFIPLISIAISEDCSKCERIVSQIRDEMELIKRLIETDEGPKGKRGRNGAAGLKGEAGMPGYSGAPGERGEPGIRIITNGWTDQNDQNWLFDTQINSPPGPKGFKGKKGHPGMNGDPGSKGNQGQPGSPGLQGIKGLKGSKGMMGQTLPIKDDGL